MKSQQKEITHQEALADELESNLISEDSINSPEAKTAFFITPLGSENSDVRRVTDGIIEAVIKPVLSKHKIYLTAPHQIKNPGNITKQIIRQILSADLVIADLTGLNANVMYELAVRHAKRLPVIVIAQHGTKLPFDLAAERTFFYYNDMAGVVQLIADLDNIIPKALEEELPDNPIYNGAESLLIREEVVKGNDPVQAYIVEKLDQLTETVAIMRNSRSDQPSSIYVGTETYLYKVFFKVAISETKVNLLSQVVKSSFPELSMFEIFTVETSTKQNFLVKSFSFLLNDKIPTVAIKKLLELDGFPVSEITITPQK